MDTGIKISASAHVALIAAAIFSGQLFDAAPEEAVSVAQVSLISGDELDAMTIQSVAETNIDDPTPSETETVDVEPTASEEPEPTPPEPVEPEPVEPEPVEAEPVGEVETADVGTEAIIEQAGEVKDEEFAMAAPKQADIVADQVTEKPEEIAKPVEQAIPSVTPKAKPENLELVEPQEQETPKETTTKVVTEADDEPENDPIKSVRPKGRPQQLAKLEEPTEEEPAEPEPAQTATPEEPTIDPLEQAILDDLKNQEANRAAAADQGVADAPIGESNARSGSPLSQSEKDGLILAIKECWNVPFGQENAEDLVVTVGFELHPDGRLKGQINFLSEGDENVGPTAAAYRAARRAIVRCLPYDKLPQEKYDTWKQVEVTFDPQKMVLR